MFDNSIKVMSNAFYKMICLTQQHKYCYGGYFDVRVLLRGSSVVTCFVLQLKAFQPRRGSSQLSVVVFSSEEDKKFFSFRDEHRRWFIVATEPEARRNISPCPMYDVDMLPLMSGVTFDSYTLLAPLLLDP